jgi:predicted Fe-Mo cluster-binding NifX family protein
MNANGIKVIVGAPILPLRELVESYIQGKLESGENRCDH